jgi:hypothetical protein
MGACEYSPGYRVLACRQTRGSIPLGMASDTKWSGAMGGGGLAFAIWQ